MRDGTVLKADVYHPVSGGPWPVLVQRTPHDKSVKYVDLPLTTLTAVRRGFIIVHQDVEAGSPLTASGARGSSSKTTAMTPFVGRLFLGEATVLWGVRTLLHR
jgi:hypothetical protein